MGSNKKSQETNSSTEISEFLCQLCDVTDAPAARYCKSCHQFMCLPCSKIHSKIYVSKIHADVVTSNAFQNMKKTKSNFDRRLAPLDCINTPACNPCGKYSTHYCVKYGKFAGILPQDNGLYCHLLFTVSKETNGTIYTVDTSGGLVNTPTLGLPVSQGEARSGAFTTQCTLDGTTIYGTIPQSRTVFKLDASFLSDGTPASVLFKTFGECHGIVRFDSGLAVSVYVPTPCGLPYWQIQFLGMNGKVKRQVIYDASGKALFQEAMHLATNSNKDVLYVADKAGGKILALDSHGNILVTYSVDYPIGIALDSEENIYVGSGKRLIQIKRGQTDKRELLTATGAVDHIWFSKSINVLAVAFGSYAVGLYKFLE